MSSKRNVIVAVGVVAVVVVLVAVALARRSDAPSPSPSPSASPAAGDQQTAGSRPEAGSTVPDGSTGDAQGGAAGGDGAGTNRPDAPPTPPPTPTVPRQTTTTSIPLNVAVSNTSNLANGEPITVTVTPAPGSSAFGFELFLCKSGVTFTLDSDIRPDEQGKCVSKPLSPNSDDYKLVQGQPPYTSVSAEFRVGVGTDTFQMMDGRTVSITCGPGNPCQIVAKVQFPDGYGFRAFPVTYR